MFEKNKLVIGIIILLTSFINVKVSAQFNRENIFPKIKEVMNKAAELDVFSGCVLVAKGDSMIFAGACGEANKDFHIKNTLETKFNLASGTKPFTGVAIMLLAQKGLLSINDAVTKYLPDFPFGDKITIFHLLTHTSGLGHYSEEYNQKMHTIRGFDAFLEQFIYKEKLLFEPGTKLSYSNSGAVVLGAIIEKVSGIQYAEFLQQNIFEPLNMKNTCHKMPEEIIENRASGYRKSVTGKYTETSLWVSPPTSATGLRTTIMDLFTFMRAIHKNKLLTEENKKIMFTPFLSDAAGPYALLWDTPNGGVFLKTPNKVVGHRGGQPGFSSFNYHYIDDDITIITLSNYENDYFIYRPIEAIVFGKEYALPKVSVDVFLYSLIRKEGSDQVLKNITKILEENKHLISSPDILNDAGYTLMEDDLETAINFFRLNVELFKNDANVYDSLGEAYMNSGNTELAIKNYEKSLELNSQNTNAIEQIEKLKKK